MNEVSQFLFVTIPWWAWLAVYVFSTLMIIRPWRDDD